MIFSRLDRAQSIAGESDAVALRRTVDHARFLEEIGFHRFFVAEHHGVPGIPGSAPTVLAAAVAAATSSIQVGTAGIMLPAHQPLIAAEQIGVLEALYPGRVDAGIGNSVGFTPPVREALGQGDPAELKQEFPRRVAELLAFLRGDAPVTARPANAGVTPVWLLAGFKSVLTAAELGINVIVGGPSLFARDSDSHPYLDRFREIHPAGHVIVAVDIAVADTREGARELLLPQVVTEVRSRTTGSFEALRADWTLTPREQQRVEEGLGMTIYGTPDEVYAQLQELQKFTGADDFLVTGGMADLVGQARSEQYLAEMQG
ncbi:MsnO8 family LLM class oxidoreductase [Corynebacterium breve]|uniref:MsnO8 family LLM class oxidoreductase n=1 Tax=Corynebacterium breve TaxID=3049799 RepID=A0ABY8VCL2_9CORY|nr:MsnO8 family LLM class oxidoreductase [Corynebacterium breve]WIM67228.1 MsnO8 family LLM class oxidoreductase [Corynebacterium breve]